MSEPGLPEPRLAADPADGAGAFRVARERMVRDQVAAAGIDDPRVLRALREVPRHLFVPRLLRHRAYEACALPIGHGQTISKPLMVALMTALLELRGDERVLEIGTGSGYQAAVLSRVAREVVTIERLPALARRAAAALAELGHRNVEVLAADGCEGLPARGPWDGMLVTACAPELPDALLRQLAEGGRLLIPVEAEEGQVLVRCRRQGDDVVIERSIDCRFVPLVPGLAAEEGAGG